MERVRKIEREKDVKEGEKVKKGERRRENESEEREKWREKINAREAGLGLPNDEVRLSCSVRSLSSICLLYRQYL